MTATIKGKKLAGTVRAVAAKSCAHRLLICAALADKPCMVEIAAAVTCTGVTGVEMEALTAVSVAALTIYDMCKAVQKDMQITNIRLLAKSGGKSGDYIAEASV